MSKERRKGVLAIGAHPDDIEFMMAGTLILLGRAGYELHCMTVANGSGGTTVHTKEEIIRIRRRESRAACAVIGAAHHPSLVDDMEITYDPRIAARVGTVIREVNPEILLVPSPEDYMEDHVNTCRLAVSAAFVRGVPNIRTRPARRAVEGDATVYHALPTGLRDGLRRKVFAGLYVDISAVMGLKREALACHKSQKEWLDHSQGMDSYLDAMERMSREVGRMSGRFRYAEGWRRHNHLGFSAKETDPVAAALGNKARIDREYERSLDKR
ncbi:MAG: PIG-L deacetylase family protein [Planctomycetota bacterium]